MTAIERAIRTTEQLASDALAELLHAASLAFAIGGEDDAESLPPAALARLQRDAAQACALFDSLAATRGLGGAFHDLGTIAEDAGERILAIAALVDTLVGEAERRGGTQAGRGAYKRQQVKAALLYGARRSGYRMPWVPAFLEPVLFSIGADIAIDFTVAHINAHGLWDADLRRAPDGWWARILGSPLPAIRTALARVAQGLAGLVWSAILAANPLAPGLRKAVDRVVAPDPEAFRALTRLRDFLAANPRFVTGIAALFGIATRQAELLTALDGPRKQAYVRALIMIVLRRLGLAGRSALLDRIIEAVVTIGIDATVALFNRRGLFT